MNEINETDFVAYEPCPKCQSMGNDTSGDNLARYSDGHGFCFSCKHYEHSSDLEFKEVKQVEGNMITGEFKPLIKRKLDENTCKVFGYQVGDSSILQ